MGHQIIDFEENMPPVKMEVIQIDNIARNWHDCFEVVWIIEGEINIIESNMMFQLKEGDIYVTNYNETHKLFTSGTTATIALIHIDHKYFEKYIPNLKEISFSHYCFSNNLEVDDSLKNIRKYLVTLYKLLDQDTINEKTKVKIDKLTQSLLLVLIDTFQYIYYKKTDDGYQDMLNKTINLSKDQIERIHRLTYYIYMHSSEKLTLNDLANSEYYSRFHISHFLKKAYGLSYQDILSLSRISVSERLLLGTGNNIETIAEEVGFSNRSQFCQHFKKWHGMSPARFRKENSAESPGNTDLVFPLDDDSIYKFLDSIK